MIKRREGLVDLFCSYKLEVGIELGAVRGDFSYKINKGYK